MNAPPTKTTLCFRRGAIYGDRMMHVLQQGPVIRPLLFLTISLRLAYTLSIRNKIIIS